MVAVRGDQVSYEGPVRAMLGPGAAPDFEADQWTARGVRAAGFDIMLIAVYMDDGVGFQKQNLARAEQISIFVKALKCQWIIVGDWNFEADAISQLEWPRYLGGSCCSRWRISPAPAAEGGSSTSASCHNNCDLCARSGWTRTVLGRRTWGCG